MFVVCLKLGEKPKRLYAVNQWTKEGTECQIFPMEFRFYKNKILPYKYKKLNYLERLGYFSKAERLSFFVLSEKNLKELGITKLTYAQQKLTMQLLGL